MKSIKSMKYCSLAHIIVLILFLGMHTGEASKLVQASQNQLHLEALEREQGIYDRVVQKLQQKEEAQKKFVQEQVNEQLIMQEQQNLNQQREILTNSPYPSTMEGDLQDVQQALKEINTNGKKTQKKLSYEEQIDQIAQQQDSENDKYKDDYEGFGSLTEMVKNKDTLAEKRAEEEKVVEENRQAQEEEKQKKLAKIKAKMTAALDKETQERKVKEAEEANKRKMAAQIRKMVKENSLLAISTKKDTKKTVVLPKKVIKKPVVKKPVKAAVVVNKKKPVVKPKIGKMNLLAAKLTSKLSAKKPAKMAASLVDGAPPSSSVLVSVSTSETQQLDEVIQNNSTEKNNTKLVDGQLNQVIDEVQTEQEAKIEEQKFKSAQPQVPAEAQEVEEPGYLSKFKKKFSNLQDPVNSDNQQVQVASEIDVSEQNSKKKGIRERFTDKMDQENSDQEKTQEIINTVQRDMTRSKKQNLLDRESERLIREQNDELVDDTVTEEQS